MFVCLLEFSHFPQSHRILRTCVTLLDCILGPYETIQGCEIRNMGSSRLGTEKDQHPSLPALMPVRNAQGRSEELWMPGHTGGARWDENILGIFSAWVSGKEPDPMVPKETLHWHREESVLD